MPFEVDLEPADAEGAAVALSGPSPPPPQDRPAPGDEFPATEGPDHVVVGAELEGRHPVGLVGPVRHHDESGLGRQPTADLDAVAVGQRRIEDNEVDGARPAECRLPRRDRLGFEAVVPEQALELGGQFAVPLDDQRPGGGGRDDRRRRACSCLHHQLPSAEEAVDGPNGRAPEAPPSPGMRARRKRGGGAEQDPAPRNRISTRS